jgi:hypothetical protein
MAAKALLPYLGGGASVWNTCMMFYQVLLLIGYAYAAKLSNLRLSRQLAIHCFVCIVSMLFLPIAGISPATISPDSPILWAVSMLFLTIGLPFFLISSQGPMLQSWFSKTKHAKAKDPYFLFAASNLGSFFALLCFPLFFEIIWSLATQRKIWSGFYLALCLLVAACGFLAYQLAAGTTSETTKPQTTGTIPTIKLRLHWLLLAFIPSAHMLAVTNYISSDVGSLPLVWVLPLAIYLLTFVIAFGDFRFQKISWLSSQRLKIVMIVLFLLVTGLVAAKFGQNLSNSIFWLVGFHLVLFGVLSTSIHQKLAALRPEPSHLGSFYLWLGAGGALGGVLNSFVAPIVLTRLHEYPLMLALAIMFRNRDANKNAPVNWLDFALPGLLTLSIYLLPRLVDLQSLHYGLEPSHILMLGALSMVFMLKRPVRLGLAVIGIMWSSSYFPTSSGDPVFVERSFYGIHKIYRDQQQRLWLEHGNTIHGGQGKDDMGQPVPLTYYHPNGPVGELFSQDLTGPVAVIGLGSGAMAHYAKPGVPWTFFEIDPAVQRIAESGDTFRFLADRTKNIKVVLGDGRLKLKNEMDESFQLLIIDAFGSDSIPVHLLTVEAVREYRNKLKDGGAMAFHISNRFLDLEPLLVQLSKSMDWDIVSKSDLPLDEEINQGRYASNWVLIAPKKNAILSSMKNAGWDIPDTKPVQLWTDDYSSIIYLFESIKFSQ